MTVEIRDIITAVSVLVAFIGMMLVNRNAKRALRPAAENTDLTRIRDLRGELAETKAELTAVKGQVHTLSLQLTAANEDAMAAYRERHEMLRYARMPGVNIDDWLARFDQMPPELNGRPDRT